MGTNQNAVGTLLGIERDGHAGQSHQADHGLVLGLRAVAPVDAIRLAHLGDRIDPAGQTPVALMTASRLDFHGETRHSDVLLASTRQKETRSKQTNYCRPSGANLQMARLAEW